MIPCRAEPHIFLHVFVKFLFQSAVKLTMYQVTIMQLIELDTLFRGEIEDGFKIDSIESRR
jgi:hypothetical protein